MENFKTVVICVLSLVVVGLSITLCLIKPKVITKTETLIKIDTVETIVYKEVPKEKIKYIHSHTIDTIYLKESVDQITIEQKCYTDSLSDIYISGFQPSLDSIHYHIPKQTIYVDKVVEVPQVKKWYQDRFVISVGLYTGYSPIYNNFDVIVGFGVGVRLGN